MTVSTCRVKEKVCRAKQSKIIEPTASLSVKSRDSREYIDDGWLPHSAVYRTIIPESLYKKLCKLAPQMRLRENRVKFTAYGSTQTLPVMGRVKRVLKNAKGLKVKLMACVVQGGKESLLG